MKIKFIVRRVASSLVNLVPGDKPITEVSLAPVIGSGPDSITQMAGEIFLVAKEDLGFSLGQTVTVTLE